MSELGFTLAVFTAVFVVLAIAIAVWVTYQNWRPNCGRVRCPQMGKRWHRHPGGRVL